MQEKEQYAIDILKALATETIKKLWVIIILLIVLLFGTNATWIVYELQWETVDVTQNVEQEADNGINRFVGGDYYGAAESDYEGQNKGQ